MITQRIDFQLNNLGRDQLFWGETVLYIKIYIGRYTRTFIPALHSHLCLSKFGLRNFISRVEVRKLMIFVGGRCSLAEKLSLRPPPPLGQEGIKKIYENYLTKSYLL